MTALEKLAEEKGPQETGGLLVGYFSGDDKDVVITGITGPGPKAQHGRHSFCPDYASDRVEMERIFEKSDGLAWYLGDWHTHPTGHAYLSFLDRKALKSIAKFEGNFVPRPIMLILGRGGGGTSSWVPRAWRIYRLPRTIFGWIWRFDEQEITIFDAT
ncbi:Mov34/MPN/PAD-1 family protein [Geomonas nitrogeniifigens]|uniref:Mov34/MPN/PAD-1 family protein n=1 Tax=Geomonas diazotrophica TaxID=2843197 RepID=UPI001C2C15B9|nr:Mov34/MPN/PAD-1 family protein [Geomonas nitrogeniifigens]QXE85558.1 Mov34/MPN/PAD-1 family protein [Geomonas nitrogeniifigens]